MRIAVVFLAACLTAVPSAAVAARHCLSGTVSQGTQPQPGAHVKLVSDQREVSTFAKAKGAYAICADDGAYTLEVRIGQVIYTARDVRIERDEVRNLDVATLPSRPVPK